MGCADLYLDSFNIRFYYLFAVKFGLKMPVWPSDMGKMMKLAALIVLLSTEWVFDDEYFYFWNPVIYCRHSFLNTNTSTFLRSVAQSQQDRVETCVKSLSSVCSVNVSPVETLNFHINAMTNECSRENQLRTCRSWLG